MPRESLRASLGDVESQIHGRPGYITRYEKAILEQLSDVAVRDYQKLPSKVAARVPLQQFVAEEVKKMLGTLSHNVTPQAQENLINIKRQQDQEEAKKRYESEIKARNDAVLQYIKSKVPKIGPAAYAASIRLKGQNHLGKLRVEATNIKKALGYPVTGIMDEEFTNMSPSLIRARALELPRRYESDYVRNHPELREEAERSIPPVPPLESFTNLDSRGETFDPMVRQALKDNFSLGQEEIKAGFDQDTKLTRDMILGKALRVGESPLGEAREISDYLSDRNRYKGQAIYEEMSENYLSNILPKANLGFMQGAWNSPLRRSHNDRVLSNLHKDIVRTRMGMEAKTAEKGLEEAGQQQARQLYSAKGAADMLNQQQREASIAAETLGGLEKTKVGADLAKIEAARLIGGEEQALEGSRLQEIQNEALRQQENDMYMLEKQLGVTRGIPTSSFATQQQVMQQPNYAAIGAGGIGNIASSMMFGQQQQPQTRKSGGLINKYAPGGVVLPSVENDPQAQLIEQEAQSLLNQQYDPQQALLHSIAKAGDKIQERYTGMPGIAGDMADTHLAHKEAQEVKRARGLNLMQQIHASRIKQQEFLAEMDYKNRTLGETSRHHRTLEGIKERKLTAKDNPKFEHQEQAKQHYKSEQELKNKFLEHQEDNQKARDMIDSMESSYKKGIGPTGPIMGHTPDILIKNKKLANRQNVMGEAAEELFKILGKQKGVQSDKDMAEMRKTLPNEYSPDERWKEWFAKGRKMVERGDRYSEFINQAEAEGLSRYEAQKMWNAQLKEESKQASGDVQIRDPEGNIRLIPASKVDEALQAGGQRV